MPISDKVTLAGNTALARLIIPSSFLATIDGSTLKSGTPVTLAFFRLGKGGWIIQAKATIRADSPQRADIQLHLTAIEGATVTEDRALASVDSLGYATIVTMLGVHVSATSQVELQVTKQGLDHVDLSGVVIAAIHQDDLTIGAM